MSPPTGLSHADSGKPPGSARNRAESTVGPVTAVLRPRRGQRNCYEASVKHANLRTPTGLADGFGVGSRLCSYLSNSPQKTVPPFPARAGTRRSSFYHIGELAFSPKLSAHNYVEGCSKVTRGPNQNCFGRSGSRRSNGCGRLLRSLRSWLRHSNWTALRARLSDRFRNRVSCCHRRIGLVKNDILHRSCLVHGSHLGDAYGRPFRSGPSTGQVRAPHEKRRQEQAAVCDHRSGRSASPDIIGHRSFPFSPLSGALQSPMPPRRSRQRQQARTAASGMALPAWTADSGN